MGHMNVAWYVAKFDEATAALRRDRADAFAPARRKPGDGGVEQHIQYKRAFRRGCRPVSSACSRSRQAIRFAHEMKNDESGEVAATTVLVAVHLDAVTRRARALPADVRERARSMIDGQET